MTATIIQFPRNNKTNNSEKSNMNTVNYVDNSRGPIPFDKLRPGSLFRIVAEPSRGIYRSKDRNVYRRDPAYYYSTNVANQEHSIVLYPQDLVMPVREDRPRNAHPRPQRRSGWGMVARHA